MMQHPVSDNGLAGFAIFASIVMLIIGGGLIASMSAKKTGGEIDSNSHKASKPG